MGEEIILGESGCSGDPEEGMGGMGDLGGTGDTVNMGDLVGMGEVGGMGDIGGMGEMEHDEDEDMEDLGPPGETGSPRVCVTPGEVGGGRGETRPANKATKAPPGDSLGDGGGKASEGDG
ncbi:unnamed protein product [Meganyctiphanes norvegica]|uniref:Uncharacterized protein n=1 Tax=Meganyctiphanes norvegica TaxID=48144 RepID=A0AAV2RR40_MEGNR